jgi:hypothetical protein
MKNDPAKRTRELARMKSFGDVLSSQFTRDLKCDVRIIKYTDKTARRIAVIQLMIRVFIPRNNESINYLSPIPHLRCVQ